MRDQRSIMAIVPGVRAVVATLLLIPVANATAQAGERYTLKGNDLAIYNLVGQIHVTGAATGSATVAVTRRGRDAAKLRVETGPARGHEALRVIYPDDEITIPDSPRRRWRTEMRVRDDGTFGDNDKSDRWGRDGRRVRISSDGGGLEAAADIELSVPNGVALNVHLGVGEATVRNVQGNILVDVSGANVTVSDTKGSLRLDTGSGDVSVTNADGVLDFDTGSGDVTARNLSGPSLTMDTGSGGVRIDGCTVDKINLDTGSGSLVVTDLRARNISLDSGSGSVTLGFLANIESLSIDSGSGNVSLTFPASLSARLSVDTGSGDITSDFPIQVTSRSRDNLIGRIGEGTGRIVIETGSGDVRLRKSN